MNPSTGDEVEWEYGSGIIGRGRARGEVIETGLEKFGYNDIIRVKSGRTGDDAYIRPDDVTRVY